MDVIIVVAVVGAFWEGLLTQDLLVVDKVTFAFLFLRADVSSIDLIRRLLSPFVVFRGLIV